MKPLMQFIEIPKVRVAASLFLIFITASIHSPSARTILVLFFSLLGTIGTDLVFFRIKKVNKSFPLAGLVSGLIIALLTSPTLPWYEPLLTGIIAMTAKNLLRFSNRHIFNPAGLGVFLASLLFGHSVSWWGVSWQQLTFTNLFSLISFFILLFPMATSAIGLKRYYTIASFLLINALISQITLGKFLLVTSLSDPTILFFAGTMLPEPMTSPIRKNRQIIYGTLIALFAFSIGSGLLIRAPILKNIPDALIFGLLLGNLIFFKKR